MSSPDISIIIPTYQAKTFFSETIASLQAQSFQNFEVLVVDDGSTDGTQALIQEFSAQDSRFKLIDRSDEKQKGICFAFDAGMLQSRGKYLFRANADDLYQVQCLQKMFELLENNPQITACIGDHEVFDERGSFLKIIRVLEPEYFPWSLYFDDVMIGTTGTLIRRSAWLKTAGKYDDEFLKLPTKSRNLIEDSYRLYQMDRVDWNFMAIPEVLYRFRHHAGQASNTQKMDEPIVQAIQFRKALFRKLNPDTAFHFPVFKKTDRAVSQYFRRDREKINYAFRSALELWARGNPEWSKELKQIPALLLRYRVYRFVLLLLLKFKKPSAVWVDAWMKRVEWWLPFQFWHSNFITL